MEEYSFSTQSIEFEHIVNVRELGGYLMSDGRRIRHGALLRGGRLRRATDGDIKRLSKEFHVAKVFDFRTQEEREYAPDLEVPGAENIWLPTMDMDTNRLLGSTLPHEAYRDLPGFLLKHSSEPAVLQASRNLYPDLVYNEYSQLQYSSFLQMVATNPEGAVYWHCSQGKDRTGMGAAYLLAALGADKELIVRDFDISNEYYETEVADAIALADASGGATDAFRETIRAFIGVSTENFVKVLGEIDSKYGSLESYLTDILLFDKDDMRMLRDKYLE